MIFHYYILFRIDYIFALVKLDGVALLMTDTFCSAYVWTFFKGGGGEEGLPKYKLVEAFLCMSLDIF